MVEVSEIIERRFLEMWLQEQPDSVRVAIAHRASMRILPFFVDWIEAGYEDDVTALVGMHRNLIAQVSLKYPTQEIEDAVIAEYSGQNGSYLPKYDQYDPSSVNRHSSAFYAITAIAHTVQHLKNRSNQNTDQFSADAVETAVDAFARDAYTGNLKSSATLPILWSTIRKDCRRSLSGESLEMAPLWMGAKNPLAEMWDACKTSLAMPTAGQEEKTDSDSDTADWSFWIKWYDDALEGREPNWEMLKEIALIEPAEWEKGPEYINNEVIARIVEKHSLLREVQGLRDELAAVHQTAITAAPMGHNNPPEEIEAEVEAAVITQTEVIWAALGEVEEELSKPEPSPSRLKRVGAAILEALKSVMKYGVGLLDITLKSAAKEGGAALGKWGVRGLVAWVALQNPHLTSVIHQLIEYANGLRK